MRTRGTPSGTVYYVGLVDAVWQPQAQDHVLESTTRFIWQNNTQQFDSPSHDQASKQTTSDPSTADPPASRVIIIIITRSATNFPRQRRKFLDLPDEKIRNTRNLRNSHRKISTSNLSTEKPPHHQHHRHNPTHPRPPPPPPSTIPPMPPRIHFNPILYTLHGS